MIKVKRCCFCGVTTDVHILKTIGNMRGVGEYKNRYVCGHCATFDPHTKEGVEELRFCIAMSLLKMIGEFVKQRPSKIH